MTPDAGKVTAYLAEVRERLSPRPGAGGQLPGTVFGPAGDVPRLLAAVEAVLALHEPLTRRQGWSSTCRFDNHRWPCPELLAITTALLGGGDDDT